MNKILKWILIIFGIIILTVIISPKSDKKEIVSPVIQEIQQTIKPTLIPTTQPTLKPTSVITNQSSQVKVVVKKSINGICHAPGTTYYDRTINYVAYDSIDDCLKSGGRLPKN